MKKIFKLIKATIQQSNSIAIFGHKSSDADCIGSLLSLYYVLKGFNKQVDVFVEDISNNLKLLDQENIICTTFPKKEYDICISVDTATIKQMGRYGKFFQSCKKTIMIDHHSTGDSYADINLIDSSKSSNCDLLVEFYTYLKCKFTKTICNALFAGIMGDTARLLHSGNNLTTYKNCIFLIENGADAKFINNILFRNISKQTFNLKRKMFERAEIKNKYAICIISNEELPKSNYTTDDFVNEMLSIDTVKISVLCIEKEKGRYSISIRTKDNISASDLAKELGGGGHFNASGASMVTCDKNLVYNTILKLIKKYLKG